VTLLPLLSIEYPSSVDADHRVDDGFHVEASNRCAADGLDCDRFVAQN